MSWWGRGSGPDDETRRIAPPVREQEQLVTRPHVRVLVGPGLVLVCLAPSASYLAGRLPAGEAQTPLRLLVVLGALALLLPLTVVPFWRWLWTSYVLTDHRLLVRRGPRRRVARDLALSSVSRVGIARPGLLDRLLRSGTLVVDSAVEGRRLLLHDVPEISEVRAALAALVGEAPRGRDPRR
ncbi:MAG: PH domain-containing protein [Actinomycetota bacterium]|nr:PH domain-containing protein [Actinomycetota bacterium]